MVSQGIVLALENLALVHSSINMKRELLYKHLLIRKHFPELLKLQIEDRCHLYSFLIIPSPFTSSLALVDHASTLEIT